MSAKKEPKKIQSDNVKDELSTDIVEIEQELKALNPTVFDGIPAKKKAELIQTIRMVSITEKHHSGPLPDPETLTQYGQIIPNGAERIMVMAENQSAHRLGLENYAVKEQMQQSGRGQIFGFIIAIIAIACGTYLTVIGESTVGGILLGTTLVSLVSIFVLGKIIQKK